MMAPLSKRLSSSRDDDIELRRGPWTVEEDAILVHYIVLHGKGRWNMLAKGSGLRRTGKSCRLRWLNYLNPGVKRGNLTPQEQLLILELHSKWGNRWSKIASHLPGRTDNEIKNYWRTRVQKQASHLKVDSNSASFPEATRCYWMPRLLQKIQGSTGFPSKQSSAHDSQPCQTSESTPSFASLHCPLNIDLTQTPQRSSLVNSSSSSSLSKESMSVSQLIPQGLEYPKISPHVMADSDTCSFLKAYFPFDNIGYDMDTLSPGTANFKDVIDYAQMDDENNIIADVLDNSFWSMDEI